MAIKLNAARCLICKDEIESRHRHDFVTCSCGNLSVDGGKDYLKRCFEKADMWIDLYVLEEDKDKTDQSPSCI